jgi:CubicO group peptidase (beta-lactamase class C family)
MIGKKRLLVALLFGVAVPGLAPAQAPAPPSSATAPSATAPAIDQVIPAIDRHFRDFQQQAHVPGMAWAIVRGGRLVHVGTSGVLDVDARRPVDADSLFRIASMSKAFTALAILKLRDEGRLSLDALAETYVPELQGWHYPTADSPRIRVRDLLSHAAGFVTDNPWGDRQQPMPDADFTRILAEGVPFSTAPGTGYEYSNFGFALLGRIITNVSGRPFKDYIEQEIMRPLGMASTGYEVAESASDRRALGYRWENERWLEEPTMAHGAFGAMGGVQTSINDYAHWIAFLLSAWPPRDDPEAGPVRRASVRELAEGLNFPQQARRLGSVGGPCTQAVAYGMGLRVGADCDLGFTLAHGGGYPGYGSYMLLLPDQDVGIFAFANGTYAAPVAAVFDAAMELHGAGLLRPRPVPVSEALAAAYRAAGAIYQAGNVEGAGGLLAMNFLMDRSATDWARDLAGLKLVIGDCRTDAPLTPTGRLSGRFRWTCARGTLEGELLLAPTNPAGIQELHLELVPLE